MENLIESLLKYSRVGRVDLAFGETNLTQVLADVLDSLHLRLRELNVEVRIPHPLPTVPCDRVRVAEVCVACNLAVGPQGFTISCFNPVSTSHAMGLADPECRSLPHGVTLSYDMVIWEGLPVLTSEPPTPQLCGTSSMYS